MSGSHVRSDFFVSIVLADAHLRAGDVDEACRVALDALDLGEQLRSGRCVSYLRDFRTALKPARELAARTRTARTGRRPQAVDSGRRRAGGVEARSQKGRQSRRSPPVRIDWTRRANSSAALGSAAALPPIHSVIISSRTSASTG